MLDMRNMRLQSLLKSGEVLDGEFPRKKLKLVQAWAELHQDELMNNWEMACDGQPTSKIKPLT